MLASIWLRSETKAHEQRTPLTPQDAKKLIEKGIKIRVESFPERIFKDQEYEDVGCEIVDSQSWDKAPKDALILGLKELPDSDSPLSHQHVFFAHAYKGQSGGQEILQRFVKGEGKLFDLEYLTDEKGRRVCAFGRWAGYVGAGAALNVFYHGQISTDPVPPLKAFPNKEAFLNDIRSKKEKVSKKPKIIVIGALGRCGQGAIELVESLGLEATPWDLEETKKGGPFSEILEHDVFVNTVLVTRSIPPFLTKELLAKNETLDTICDVSCDPTSQINPLPIYSKLTDWQQPSQTLSFAQKDIKLISVDNLPSVLPKESSEDFSSQLCPHLIDLFNNDSLPTAWSNSYQDFKRHAFQS